MQPDSETEDLEYLSALGYEAISTAEADVRRIEKKVRSLAISYQSGAELFVVWACMFLFLAISTCFYFVDLPYRFPPAKSSEPAAVPVPAPAGSQPVVPAVPAPAKQQQTSRSSVQGTGKEEPVTVPGISAETMERIQLPDWSQEESKDEELRSAMNSPVRFIRDLKVTDYNILYFKPRSYEYTRGLSANFAGDAHRNILSAEPTVYLHEELDHALYLFKKKRTQEALQVFSALLQHNSEDLNARFYSGLCLYEMHRYAQAAQQFEFCASALNNAFREEAEYYLALTHLASGDAEKGREALRRIEMAKGFYAGKASAALEAGAD